MYLVKAVYRDRRGGCIVYRKIDAALEYREEKSRVLLSLRAFSYCNSILYTSKYRGENRTLHHLLVLLGSPRLHAQHKPRNAETQPWPSKGYFGRRHPMQSLAKMGSEEDERSTNSSSCRKSLLAIIDVPCKAKAKMNSPDSLLTSFWKDGASRRVKFFNKRLPLS